MTIRARENKNRHPGCEVSLHVIPMEHEAPRSRLTSPNSELADLSLLITDRRIDSGDESIGQPLSPSDEAASTFPKHRRILRDEDSQQAGQVGHRRVTDRSLNGASSTYAERVADTSVYVRINPHSNLDNKVNAPGERTSRSSALRLTGFRLWITADHEKSGSWGKGGRVATSNLSSALDDRSIRIPLISRRKNRQGRTHVTLMKTGIASLFIGSKRPVLSWFHFSVASAKNDGTGSGISSMGFSLRALRGSI